MIDSIDKIIEAFWGYDLFYVGGIVRDFKMWELGFNIKESNDVDLATNSTPAGMITLCKSHGLEYRYTKNSIAHGTITIEGFEITTFRKDISSIDGHNAIVEFSDFIEEDLSRRDFSCNAMAICVYTGRFVDPFNGMQDIKNKIVRAVGNPIDRMNEDTLRAMRAITRANKDGFIIEKTLIEAIKNTDISNLSIERIKEEFMKILSTRNDRYIILILTKVIPEFNNLVGLDGSNKHAETVDVHSLLAMKYMMQVSDNPLDAFVGIVHDIGKYDTREDSERVFKGHEDIGAEKVKEIMLRMKFSTEDIEYVYIMIKNHMRWHFF